MTTLMIKDLTNAQDLDSKKMSAVRGGFVPFPSNNFVNIMPITFDSSKTAYVKQLNENQLGSQIATGDGNHVARPGVVELPAIDELQIAVEDEEVGGAGSMICARYIL